MLLPNDSFADIQRALIAKSTQNKQDSGIARIVTPGSTLAPVAIRTENVQRENATLQMVSTPTGEDPQLIQGFILFDLGLDKLLGNTKRRLTEAIKHRTEAQPGTIAEEERVGAIIALIKTITKFSVYFDCDPELALLLIGLLGDDSVDVRDAAEEALHAMIDECIKEHKTEAIKVINETQPTSPEGAGRVIGLRKWIVRRLDCYIFLLLFGADAIRRPPSPRDPLMPGDPYNPNKPPGSRVTLAALDRLRDALRDHCDMLKWLLNSRLKDLREEKAGLESHYWPPPYGNDPALLLAMDAVDKHIRDYEWALSITSACDPNLDPVTLQRLAAILAGLQEVLAERCPKQTGGG